MIPEFTVKDRFIHFDNALGAPKKTGRWLETLADIVFAT